MNATVLEQSQSALVKIFAAFSVTDNGTTKHWLVMENLFHGVQIVKKYDLKGIRSRTAQSKSTSRPDGHSMRRLVNLSRTNTLMDGNWMQTLYRPRSAFNPDACLSDATSSTRLLQPAACEAIKSALNRDTEFLASNKIIDYSLLVGVSANDNRLVIGMVDYVSEYNVWKRVENKSKSTWAVLQRGVSTWFGGSNRQDNHDNSSAADRVTVQPPQRYRERFLESMDVYYATVPAD
jgi:1-phosphatidylinositol-3-phosphate 5-kinase